MKYIDAFLNSITMYKLVLYSLMVTLGFAMLFGFVGWVPYSALSILFSALFVTTVCVWVNELFARVFHAPANIESAYITGLILALIVSPAGAPGDIAFYATAFWAAAMAMGSKYIFAIKRKHIFNPAAFGVAATALAGYTASWWVATLPLMPIVAVLGFFIAYKIRRLDVAISGIVAALIGTFVPVVMSGGNILNTFSHIAQESPILFFALVMLTEPLTMPATRPWRIAYGVLVGGLFAPITHIGSYYFTPETALLTGNIFAYVVSPKQKFILTLAKVRKLAGDTYEFIFTSPQRLASNPGQYMEWTLAADRADSRGNRRYFTVASSPTEKTVNLGVKFYPKPSTFKTALAALKIGDTIVASQLGGDFTLPKDQKRKLVFIAGGIGVTPFRSMIKYITDTNQKRDVTLLYSGRTPSDFAYDDEFSSPQTAWLKTVYVPSDAAAAQKANWQGKTGYINAALIHDEVPDFYERMFYISGPSVMVSATKKTLLSMGISPRRIKTDYFPGF